MKKKIYKIIFQFQYGAIKSIFCNDDDNFREDFNSNMVRLKASSICHNLYRRRFQFQYGAIKSAGKIKFISSDTDFNSNMVRLKGAASVGGFCVIISIPIWCD